MGIELEPGRPVHVWSSVKQSSLWCFSCKRWTSHHIAQYDDDLDPEQMCDDCGRCASDFPGEMPPFQKPGWLRRLLGFFRA